MFWIMGADEFVESLGKANHVGIVGFLRYELEHSEWEGFRFYDLIFPLFLFMVGISTVLSVGKLLEREGKWTAHKRILRRFALLWIWAFILDGGFAQAQVSFAGVLQRISYCYLITSLLYCHLRLRGLVTVCLVILAGYWALLSFVPVPDIGQPTFEMHKNWSNYLDKHYLPGNREARGWRNEGMLSTLPAICTCLLGVFAGLFLNDDSRTPKKKAYWLMVIGCMLAGLGFLWGMQLPVIKRIWTSSYVLVSGGYSCVLLGLFYLVVDVWGYRRWATPFVWIGSNALAMYLIGNLIQYKYLTGRVVGGGIQTWLSPYDAVAQIALWMCMLTLLARFLYKRNILLRV
ncbi:MAG: DUF5009 domain-containing protein [Candidatus Hydrogenedentes bacterium]|nr:DUF5009 domain-containing protein [Candidatus Hydrogenedentota bacterium]